MSGQEEVQSIELAEDIVVRIEKRVPHTEFESSSEYVEYVLNEVLHNIEQENELEETDVVDEQQVQDRLESLGYLNE
ncbi:hypothetical protein EXE43_14075 [Halorubrum sp. SS5]|nr:hypothetical protein EXE43_14075 [Halorubrum sp. SS5]